MFQMSKKAKVPLKKPTKKSIERWEQQQAQYRRDYPDAAQQPPMDTRAAQKERARVRRLIVRGMKHRKNA